MDDQARKAAGSDGSTPRSPSVATLLDGISDGLVAYDTEWRFVYVNRPAAAYFGEHLGTSGDTLLGKNLWESFPVMVGTPLEAFYRRAAAGTELVEVELWSLVGSRCIAYRAMPSATGLTVFFRDITEQRRMREALLQSEARLRSVYENCLEGILVTAPTGEVFDANPAACRMIGRSVESIVAGGRGALVDPADPKLATFLAERERSGRASGELTLLRGDGTKFPAACKSGIFTDGSGRRQTIITFHDLGEQRRIEGEQARTLVELREAEEQLRLTFDNAPIGKAVVALDGRCVRANQRLAEMFGYTVGELAGITFGDLTHPDDRAKDLALVASLLRGEIPRYELPKRYVRKDGVVVDILLSASLLRDPHGAPRLFILQMQDLREKKRLEAQHAVDDKKASIGTLASGIAHEINNPLAHVLLNLEILGEDLAAFGSAATPERLRALFDRVEETRIGAERVHTIVRAIEMFGREGAARCAPVDLQAILELAVNLAASELRPRAVLVKDYGAIPRVAAEESRLEQVFVNLLVNAAQAIPEGHAASNEVGIKTWTDAEGRAVVEVRDTGAGIPAHLLERIFDPFFTTKEIGLGTGLGLSISHAIITSLGGSLDVQSEVGKGTVFRVVLPGCAPVVAATAAPSSARVAQRRGRVLVIDDESAMGELLEHGLGKEHQTTSLTSAREALEQLEAGERFDAILCDVMMPDLSGPELYSLVQRFAPEQAARIIFMTGAAFSSTDWAFLDRTSHPTLRKPFVLQAVRDAVRAVVAGKPLSLDPVE
jgi:PAS domain S-box-containing protein